MHLDDNTLQKLQFRQGDYYEFLAFFYGLVSIYAKDDAVYLYINKEECILEYKFSDDKINKIIYQAIRTFEPRVNQHGGKPFPIIFRTQDIPYVYLIARERIDIPKRFYDIAKKYNIYIPQR